MLKMFLAGVIGGIATLCVSLTTPVLGWVLTKYVQVSTDTVLQQLATQNYPGKYVKDTTSVATFLGTEPELLVGGYCQIDSGGGQLQNLGIVDGGKSFVCVYSTAVKATAYATCLRRK